MEGFVDAFPDLTYTFEEILVDGNNVVIRYSWSGTNTGSFMGMPPSNNEVSCTGLEIDRIADGRIVETQNFTDMHCLLTSITPPP
jgi:predicted ester cyclase